MKIDVKVKLDLRTREAVGKVESATREGLRDTVVAIVSEATKTSPVLTGHNRRSMAIEVQGMGGSGRVLPSVAGETFTDTKPVIRELSAAVYSTSGYGGFLETGTSAMPARPYIKPAADRNLPMLPIHIRKRLEAKGG